MAVQPDLNWRPVLTRRLTVVAGVLAFWVVAIEARLVVLQVLQHEELSARAERQQSETQQTPPKRGEIYDRRGRLLAYSVDADTIYAVPTDISDPADTAAYLCGAFEDCLQKDLDQLQERLSRRRSFVYVRRRVTPIEAQRIAALELKGIGFMKESKRFYPNRELAAHLLGYVGTDNVGRHGLEATYDKTVRGREGTMLVQTDARGRAFGRLDRSPTSGGSLELTIDQQLQFIAERELKAGVEAARADGGTVVAMDPHNGEILAMASWPTFNPNHYSGTSDSALRNRAVQDLYEPGSTFKLVTASAAIEAKVVTPDEIIDVSAGSVRFGTRVIDDMQRYGRLSFTDVIVKSSNVGAINVGLRLGAERMGLFIRRFGFGRPSSPDFPGESPGIVWQPSQLNDSGLASVSMGYQIGVTPLQMAAAASVIANGGTLYEPHVVLATVKAGVRTVVPPKAVRRVILPETAATLTSILEAVVTGGTAKRAALANFSVAGKTGTADKLVNGRYSSSHQNVSFVGFVPSRNPVMTLIVMVDSPRVGGDTGGVIAAPIFRRIATASLRQMGVTPTIDQPLPVMIARRDDQPVKPAVVLAPSPVAMTTGRSDAGGLPDLRGMSARNALRELARLGLTARMQGDGVVIDQTPAPGSVVEPGATCTLVLTRRPPARPVGNLGDQR